MRYLAFTKIVSLISCTLFLACNNPTQNNSDRQSESKKESNPNMDSVSHDHSPLWSYDYNADTLIRLDANLSPSHTVADAINIINKAYEGKIILALLRQDADTLRVKIEQPEILTQQMGSTGARAYMALAVFTLTERTGIHYVTFDFEEGDHASPGTYSRYSF